MTTKRKLLLLWIVLVPLTAGCVQQQLHHSSDHTLQVSRNVTLAGSLNQDAAKLIKLHNAVVIDLREKDQGADDEAERMRARAIRYYNVPVNPSTLERSTIAQIESILDRHEDQPVLLHCKSGNRAGLVWAALLKEKGFSSDRAFSEVSPIATKPQILDAITNYRSEKTQ